MVASERDIETYIEYFRKKEKEVMQLKLNSNPGILCTALFLFAVGLTYLGMGIPALILGILALLAGILLIVTG